MGLPEEHYAGKPLKYWFRMLNDLSPGFDPSDEWQTLGTNEITVLVKALRLRDSKVNVVHWKLFSSAWNGTGPKVFKKLPVPLYSDDVALNALLILSRMGTGGRAAYPAMIHVLKQDGSGFLRDQAAGCLAVMDPNDALVRPALVASLSDTNLSPFTITWVRNRLKETESASRESQAKLWPICDVAGHRNSSEISSARGVGSGKSSAGENSEYEDRRISPLGVGRRRAGCHRIFWFSDWSGTLRGHHRRVGDQGLVLLSLASGLYEFRRPDQKRRLVPAGGHRSLCGGDKPLDD